MDENIYIQDLLDHFGFAINEKNNSEIIVYFPIKFNKKSMKFRLKKDYKVITQPLGTFLTDFLNYDFSIYEDFYNFFIKYSSTIAKYTKIKDIFHDGYCLNEDFNIFTQNLYLKNKNKIINIQEQLDMILNYCLISPNKKAIEFTPIERFYVLKEFSPNLTILQDYKTSNINFTVFSSYPGDTEDEIYKFLKLKNSFIEDLNLIIPNNISDILYKPLVAILSEKVFLKTCKNCKKYFIAKTKNTDYCSNTINNTKKTCQDIGRLNVFKESKYKDSLLNLYYNIYNRKAVMKSRNPDIKRYIDDFNLYKTIGKIKVDKYKKGLLSAADFKKWIEKNS